MDFRPLGLEYERVYLPLYKVANTQVADTPFHIQIGENVDIFGVK